MSELLGILGDPYRRTKTMYHFKVTGLVGNAARFHDASKVINVVELPNESEHTLEEQYRGQIDNLFIAVSITGQYFFYAKLSNEVNWPKFLE